MHDALARLGVPDGATDPRARVRDRQLHGRRPAGMRFIGVELDPSPAGSPARSTPSRHPHRELPRHPASRRQLDAVIGNVPFADVRLDHRGQRLSLHDFFLAKSVDALRPGGVLAVVTSHFTLDKQNAAAREHLAERADFLGAIRLPSDAFKREGTAVVTDIVFLRKRAPGEPARHADPDWLPDARLAIDGADVPVNRYFLDHPEMVLGTWSRKDPLYGGEAYSVDRQRRLWPRGSGMPSDRLPRAGGHARTGPSQSTTRRPSRLRRPSRHVAEGSFFVGDDRPSAR